MRIGRTEHWIRFQWPSWELCSLVSYLTALRVVVGRWYPDPMLQSTMSKPIFPLIESPLWCCILSSLYCVYWNLQHHMVSTTWPSSECASQNILALIIITYCRFIYKTENMYMYTEMTGMPVLLFTLAHSEIFSSFTARTQWSSSLSPHYPHFTLMHPRSHRKTSRDDCTAC